jgi:hypothetical protein
MYNESERKETIMVYFKALFQNMDQDSSSVIRLAMDSTFMDKNFSIWHQYPDWLCSSFISVGYKGLFPQDQTCQSMMLNIHFRPVQQSRMCGDLPPCSFYTFISCCLARGATLCFYCSLKKTM